MATVQTLITSARYDLRDYGKGLVFDNAELTDYINRMVGIMDSQLSALNSDLTEAEDTSLETTEDQNYIDLTALNSGLFSGIKSFWIGTDADGDGTYTYQKLENVSVDWMRHERIYTSGSGVPYYWALSGTNLLFERDADDAYPTKTYYHKKTSTLALTDNMPFNGIFDELFREMLISHAKAKKEGRMLRTDSYYQEIFRKRAMEENLRRNFIKKPYAKDF